MELFTNLANFGAPPCMIITSDDWDHSRKFPANHSMGDLVLKVAFVAWVNDGEMIGKSLDILGNDRNTIDILGYIGIYWDMYPLANVYITMENYVFNG